MTPASAGPRRSRSPRSASAKEGADVAVAHLPEEGQDARATVRAVEAAGRRAAALPDDLRQAEANADLAAGAVEQLGGLDVLVCNAAYR